MNFAFKTVPINDTLYVPFTKKTGKNKTHALIPLIRAYSCYRYKNPLKSLDTFTIKLPKNTRNEPYFFGLIYAGKNKSFFPKSEFKVWVDESRNLEVLNPLSAKQQLTNDAQNFVSACNVNILQNDIGFIYNEEQTEFWRPSHFQYKGSFSKVKFVLGSTIPSLFFKAAKILANSGLKIDLDSSDAERTILGDLSNDPETQIQKLLECKTELVNYFKIYKDIDSIRILRFSKCSVYESSPLRVSIFLCKNLLPKKKNIHLDFEYALAIRVFRS